MSYFITSDFPLSSSLIVLGYQLEKTERNNSGRVTFHFKRDERLDQIIQAYWTSKLVLDPKTFYQALKFLKCKIHNHE